MKSGMKGTFTMQKRTLHNLLLMLAVLLLLAGVLSQLYP